MSICVLGDNLGENGLAAREVELPCVCCGGSDGEEEGEGARRQVEALVYHEQHQQSGRGWRGGRSLPASHNHTRELSVEKG